MLNSFFSFSHKVFCRVKREFLIIFEFIHYKFIYRKPNVINDFGVRRLIFGFRDDNLAGLSVNYKKLFPNNINKKLKEANKICNHVFNLLNSGTKKLSNEGNGYRKIDWHIDYKSGYKWKSSTFFRYIKWSNLKNVDVKSPWELSYFHHLTLLGQAYLLTNNLKYAREYENQIKDWIDNNRVGYGIGWNCTMIVAIRAINWLVALEYFHKEAFSDAFLKEFYISINEHGRFIRNHLEYSPGATTNHYLFNLAGLLFISFYCPFFDESGRWREFALNELFTELGKQVYPDGCSFEASTSYHRFVLEMFFYVELVGTRLGIEFPSVYRNKVKQMFEVLIYGIKPNGKIPQIGDNDNGRFIKYSERPVLEHKYLLTLAAIYYDEQKFKIPNSEFDEDAFWIFGPSSKENYNKMPYRKEVIESKAFSNAGWFVIRSNNDYCFISCGPNGQNGNGGHAHNDKLSFELMLAGIDIIIDPGTYVYASYPQERNKFRSTEYHNTVKFDGYEQNEIPEKIMFSLPDRVKINYAGLREKDDNIIFEGEIQYADITHRRNITYDKTNRSWGIKDYFKCPYNTGAKLLFHLTPTVTTDGRNIFSKDTGEKIASIEVEGLQLQKGKYDYSPEYGVKKEAEMLTGRILTSGKENIVVTKIKRI